MSIDSPPAARTRQSFLPMFDEQFAGLLDMRSASFRRIFELLEEKSKNNYLLLESGCARSEDNWSGDGQSTILWDKFVNMHGGNVITVDIDPHNCDFVKRRVSPNTMIACMDSVDFFWKYAPDRPVDLLYLDSFDLDVNYPHPSSLHHLMELTAAMRFLQKGAIIVVDDNPYGTGKGMYVAEFMQHIGVSPIIADYQMAWIL